MNRVFLLVTFLTILTSLQHPIARSAASAEPQANLGITLQATPSVVVAGEQLEYGATIINTGPAQAVQVQTVFTLPDTTQVASISPAAPCSQNQLVITCTTSLLNVGQSISFTLIVDVLPNARGTILTRAAVQSSIADPNQNNNSRVVETMIDTQIDLGLTYAEPTSSVVIAGAPLIYAFQVANTGSSTASDVELTAMLPPAKFERFLNASPGITCTPASDSVSCALGAIAPMAMNASNALTTTTVITIAVQPKSTLTSMDTVLNTALIDATEAETTTANNFTSFVLNVERVSDLTLAITASHDTIRSNQPITYTLTLRNDGPSQNTGVVLTSTLPLDRLQNLVINDPICTVQTVGIACEVGTMEAGETRTITLHGIILWRLNEPFLVIAGVAGENQEPSADGANSGWLATHVNAYRNLLPFLFNNSQP